MFDRGVFVTTVSRLIVWRRIDVLWIGARVGIVILVIGFGSFLYVRLRIVSFISGRFIL